MNLKAVDVIFLLFPICDVTGKFTRASESQIMNPQKDRGYRRNETSHSDVPLLNYTLAASTRYVGSTRGLLCFLCAFKRIAFDVHLSMCMATSCTTIMIDVDYISHLPFTWSYFDEKACFCYEAWRFGCGRTSVRYGWFYTHSRFGDSCCIVYLAPRFNCSHVLLVLQRRLYHTLLMSIAIYLRMARGICSVFNPTILSGI